MSLHDVEMPVKIVSTAQAIEHSLAGLGDLKLLEDFRTFNDEKVTTEENYDELKRKHESLQWAMNNIQQIVADDTKKISELEANQPIVGVRDILNICDDYNIHPSERVNMIRDILKELPLPPDVPNNRIAPENFGLNRKR